MHNYMPDSGPLPGASVLQFSDLAVRKAATSAVAIIPVPGHRKPMYALVGEMPDSQQQCCTGACTHRCSWTNLTSQLRFARESGQYTFLPPADGQTR